MPYGREGISLYHVPCVSYILKCASDHELYHELYD
jgi:hypothetical protein